MSRQFIKTLLFSVLILTMDSTYLPYLTEDELTYELKIRGLPDVSTMTEKQNILERIFASSLTTTFPVRKPNQEDDKSEHSVCQQKLQEMSCIILALLTHPSLTTDALMLV